MTLTIDAMLLQAILALFAGILILFKPNLLNYVVAIYLIIIGAIGILKAMGVG